MRDQIEYSFSLQEINRLAMSERVTKKHPGSIHLWWNRSPIESSAILLKSILQRDGEASETEKSDITIVDPFSGSGCLTLAALSTGLPVMAGDLNSVAVVITKAVSEYPSRFIGTAPVFPDAEVKLYSGLSGLAEDIHCYGTQIRQKLYKELEAFFPDALLQENNDKQAYAWIWTRTAPCPNPACQCRMPLAGSYVLSRLKGREYHVEPISIEDRIEFRVLPGAPNTFLTGNKIGKQGAQFQCPKCGTITKDDYIKSVGKDGKLGLQLMAIAYLSDDGKIYITPDEAQIQAANSCVPNEPPLGDLPNNTRWFSPPLFGLTKYYDLFTPRQQLLMTTLCKLIVEVQECCKKDAASAGMMDDDISLEKGGTGALAYSQAIAFYLSLVVGKIANFQSEFCTWDNRTGNIRAIFTRQAIPMTWTFAEGNPFSSITGNYSTMLADVVSAIENLPVTSSAHVVKSDALNFPFPRESLLFTELPYYDNVGYADLSDYFYVWLRLCLKDQIPELFEQITTVKDELSSIPEHYGRDPQLGINAYEKNIHKFFLHFRNVATTAYPSIVFFEFGKQDEPLINNNGDVSQSLSHWENFVDALIQAGFQIIATLPVRTEMPNEKYETTRIAVLFIPRKQDAIQITRRSAVIELKRNLPVLLQKSFQIEMDDWDKPIVGMGCGLALFSEYACVLNADGSSMSVKDALLLIWHEVTEYLKNMDDKTEKTILEEELTNGNES